MTPAERVAGLRAAADAIEAHNVDPLSVGWHSGRTFVLLRSVDDLRRIECGIGPVSALRGSDGVLYTWVDPLGVGWEAFELTAPRVVVAPIREEDAEVWDEVLSSVDADLDRPHLTTDGAP